MNSDVDDAILGAEDEVADFGSESLRCEMLNPLTCNPEPSKTTLPVRSSASRRAISRVVVLHNDKVASFSNSSISDNHDDPAYFFDTPEFWSGSITWW